MALAVEDYGLIGDTQTARWSGATAPSTGCPCLDSTPPPRVVRAETRPAIRSTGGAAASEVDGGTSRDLCIIEAVVPPGGSTGVHAHAGDEHHVILSGRWRMSQGDHTVELGPGDYLAWDPSVPHDVENVGDEPGRMLIIYPRHARRPETP